MDNRKLTEMRLSDYEQHLKIEGRSTGTIEKYLRDARAFTKWLNDQAVTNERLYAWKTYLQDKGYSSVTINSMLAALNSLFRFLGWDECRVKFLKVQRRMFRDESRELSRTEYNRLLSCAKGQGRSRLALLMETICATGIRVSEVKYIRRGSALWTDRYFTQG